MPVKQLPSEADQYKNEWVAILSNNEEKIVGHGKTPKEAVDRAQQAGYPDAILLFIPAEWPKVLVV